MRRLACLILTVIIISLCSSVPISALGELEGLLLGMRYQETPEGRPAYVSYFIVHENDKAMPVEGPMGGTGGNGLMVARKSGFWFLEVIRFGCSNVNEEYLVAGPIEKGIVFFCKA